jgi:uncharacterized protein (DUF1697 family)
MTRYIALLRGINVGGRNKVPMPALRATCESIGCTEVSTYIQSGNVMLTSPLAADKLGAELERAIAEQIRVTPAVMLRTHHQLVDAAAANPFHGAEPGHLHIGFLAKELDKEQWEKLAEFEHPSEEIAVRGTEVYFHLPNGMGRAKLPELYNRRIKIPTTVRNWRTLTTLIEMSRE